MTIDDFIFALRSKAGGVCLPANQVLRGIKTVFNHSTGETSFEVSYETRGGGSGFFLIGEADTRYTPPRIERGWGDDG